MFTGYDNLVSHVGIADNVGNQSSVSIQIIGEESGFGSWVSEFNLRDGFTTGQNFIMEARSSDAYVDGLALLNLTGDSAVTVWAVQMARSGEVISEAELGTIPVGGKLLSVVSNLFSFVEGAQYRIETRTTRSIEVLGITFFSGTFFAPVPVQKR